MKTQIRLLGIDDSPFSFSDTYSRIVGVIMRGGIYIEGILSRKIKVDGNDGTDLCIDMVNKTKHKKQLKSILIISIKEAKEIIKLSTIRGVIPEPIRVAHLIASGITRGESYGKA